VTDGDGEAALAAPLVQAVAAVAAGAPPASREELRDRLAAALRGALGWRRAVIPGDRLPAPDPDGPDAIAYDLGVRGRFAGRVYAAIGCAVAEEGARTDPGALAALLAAAGAVMVRAQEAYVVVAGPGGAPGDAPPGLPAGPRSVAALVRDAPPPAALRGLRVPARLGVVAVARTPFAAGGGILWAGQVVAGGGQTTL